MRAHVLAPIHPKLPVILPNEAEFESRLTAAADLALALQAAVARQ